MRLAMLSRVKLSHGRSAAYYVTSEKKWIGFFRLETDPKTLWEGGREVIQRNDVKKWRLRLLSHERACGIARSSERMVGSMQIFQQKDRECPTAI